MVGETLEPVAIGRLERWVGDHAIKENWTNVPYIEPSGFKVGIVGSGPAGMACAADMAKAGCEVTVFEAFHQAGGVLKYGIPDFRLPNAVVDAEIENLRKLGVKFECNTLVGRLFTIEQMLDELGFDAVFIGTGAGYPSMLGIPGDSLNGVLSANELLTRCNLMRARDFPNYDTPLPLGKRVAVIGAGNTAMDAMRVSPAARRRESVLHLSARRGRSARRAPKRFITPRKRALSSTGSPARSRFSTTARAMSAPCAASAWSSASRTIPGGGVRSRWPAASSSSRPIRSCSRSAPTPTRSSARPRSFTLNKRGYIATDETLATSMAGVFAGGDIVTGAATVIEAMGAGRKAARSMKNYLGIRDIGVDDASEAGAGTFFGIDLAGAQLRARSRRLR